MQAKTRKQHVNRAARNGKGAPSPKTAGVLTVKCICHCEEQKTTHRSSSATNGEAKVRQARSRLMRILGIYRARLEASVTHRTSCLQRLTKVGSVRGNRAVYFIFKRDRRGVIRRTLFVTPWAVRA